MLLSSLQIAHTGEIMCRHKVKVLQRTEMRITVENVAILDTILHFARSVCS